MGSVGKGQARPSIALMLDRTAFPLFYPLLQSGIKIPVALSCSIQSFLCDQMGLEPDYVRERILSIVLDGHPVDDTEKALLSDGCQLALSSGMPGLAGAALRRGGLLASFRGSITHKESAVSETKKEGSIWVKLFNLMMQELGPRFLERGILMQGGEFVRLVQQYRGPFLEKCREIRRAEISIEATAFLEELGDQNEELLISVNLCSEGPMNRQP